MPIMCNGKKVSLYFGKTQSFPDFESVSINENEIHIEKTEEIDTIVVKGDYKIIIEDNASVEIVLNSGSVTAQNLTPTNIVENMNILGVVGNHQCEDALNIDPSNEVATMSNELFDDAQVDEENEMLVL